MDTKNEAFISRNRQTGSLQMEMDSSSILKKNAIEKFYIDSFSKVDITWKLWIVVLQTSHFW